MKCTVILSSWVKSAFIDTTEILPCNKLITINFDDELTHNADHHYFLHSCVGLRVPVIMINIVLLYEAKKMMMTYILRNVESHSHSLRWGLHNLHFYQLPAPARNLWLSWSEQDSSGQAGESCYDSTCRMCWLLIWLKWSTWMCTLFWWMVDATYF